MQISLNKKKGTDDSTFIKSDWRGEIPQVSQIRYGILLILYHLYPIKWGQYSFLLKSLEVRQD